MLRKQSRRHLTFSNDPALSTQTSSTINTPRRAPLPRPPSLVLPVLHPFPLTCSNPSTNPRKQTSKTTDIPSIPSTPSRFRYPLSPHKDTSPNFWDKDSHYSWIDQNTPLQPPAKIPKTSAVIPPPTPSQYQLNKQKREFSQQREKLAQELLNEIDSRIMKGQLATATKVTGGVKLVWSTRLRTAAGRAHWTRHRGVEGQHNLQIELSTKIITNEGTPSHSFPIISQPILRVEDILNSWRIMLTVAKLRDTLAHEICHCALWVINNDPRSHHGKPFKQWSPPPSLFLDPFSVSYK